MLFNTAEQVICKQYVLIPRKLIIRENEKYPMMQNSLKAPLLLSFETIWKKWRASLETWRIMFLKTPSNVPNIGIILVYNLFGKKERKSIFLNRIIIIKIIYLIIFISNYLVCVLTKTHIKKKRFKNKFKKNIKFSLSFFVIIRLTKQDSS